MVGLWLGLGLKMSTNTRFGMAWVRVRAKIEKNDFFRYGLCLNKGKNRENTLCGKVLVRASSKIEK